MRKLTFIVLVLLIITVPYVYTQDGPNTWTQTNNYGGRIYGLVINRLNPLIMYSASLDSGVYKSVNGGLTFTAVNNGLTYFKALCIAISASNPNVLYVGTDQNGSTNSGVYKTTDAGANWTFMSNGITDTRAIQALAVDPTNPNIVYAAVFDGVNASTIGMYKTTDGGANWFAANSGMSNYNILSIAINPKNPNVLYAGTSLILPGSTGPSKIYKSYNGGTNWVDVVNGLPTGTTTGNPVRALDISTSDTAVVLAALFVNDTTGGMFVTTNGGQLWQKRHNGIANTAGTLPRACMIRPGSSTEFYVGLDQSSAATPRGMWKTTNQGITWTDFNVGAMLNTYSIRAIGVKLTGDTTIYAGAATATLPDGRGIFEYSYPYTPPASWPVPDILYYKFKNNIVGGTPNYAIPGAGDNPAMLVGTSVVFAPGGQFDSCLSGTGATGGYVNTNWATNLGSGSWTISMWLNNLPSNTTLYYLFGEGTGSYRCFLGGAAGAGNVLLRGTGITDVNVPAVAPGPTVLHFVYDSATATISAYKNGVFALSVPQTPLNLATGAGFHVGNYTTSASIMGLMDEFRVYRRALTAAEILGTWNRELPAIITGTENNFAEVPKNYSLSQNYPNPFNPTTKITFAIPKSELVVLKVFDVLGREVKTLVNEVRQAGSYTIDFNASTLSSGVYFYRLTAGNYVETKSMTLIK